MRSVRLYVGLLCCVLLCACTREDDPIAPSYHTDVFKVAVIAPGEMLPNWKRTAEWAQQILHRGQTKLDRRIRVELEFHDENAANIDAYIQAVAEDESYAAIIGPVSSEKATIAARACRKLKKMLILPITSNAELQRVFSTLDHVFNLTQSDIIQLEAMFASLKEGALLNVRINNNVGLITSDDEYGETFYDWFGFLATERDFDTPLVCQLNDSLTIADVMNMHYEEYKKGNFINYLFFAPSDPQVLIQAQEEIDRLKAYNEENEIALFYYRPPVLFCSDACVNAEVAKVLKNGFEGVEPTANLTSGFIAGYESVFGEHPGRGDAQLFDAIYLVYYSLKAMLVDGRELVEDTTDEYGVSSRRSPLWEYFIKVVDCKGAYSYSWLDYDVHHVFNTLDKGEYFPITGASSTLDFDKKHHSAVTSTTYRHWRLYNGEFQTMQYFSADGSDRTISTITDWTVMAANKQELEKYVTNITYPEHKDNYAVIVAASDGWTNYRHQADALAMYHALRAQGFDDDHIILIMEDDIANHNKNLYPGTVKITSDGENLYKDAEIDYRMSYLYSADLQNILTGVRTLRTPVVLEATENDNVFLFWSGHGVSNALIYNDNEFTSSEVRQTLEKMSNNGKFRKLFFVMEACFSGSVAQACEGIKGVLMLTAANEGETSKADMFDNELGVYLSNGFTRAFQTKIMEEHNVILRDLFYYVVGQTKGSHASLYNYKNYGNIYTERLSEMLFRNAAR